jgi:hypothetical protein
MIHLHRYITKIKSLSDLYEVCKILIDNNMDVTQINSDYKPQYIEIIKLILQYCNTSFFNIIF